MDKQTEAGVVKANRREQYAAMVRQAEAERLEAYEAKCQAEFDRIANSVGVTNKIRVSVMNRDGGAFRKDFNDWSEAASMYRANVLYGSPILCVAFQWTDDKGWQEMCRYPTH